MIRWEGVLSESREVNIGVSQRSILAPLLFSLYVNDLLSDMEGASVMVFADDTTIVLSHRTPDELSAIASTAVITMHSRVTRNDLSLNGG